MCSSDLAQSLATIAKLLERAMEPGIDPIFLHGLIVQAHTHAVLQCVSCRRAEARALFAKFPDLEHGPIQ